MPEDATSDIDDAVLSDESAKQQVQSSSTEIGVAGQLVATTLVEILPGTALVFGEVPEGL
jgi:hypothetical protein